MSTQNRSCSHVVSLPMDIAREISKYNDQTTEINQLKKDLKHLKQELFEIRFMSIYYGEEFPLREAIKLGNLEDVKLLLHDRCPRIPKGYDRTYDCGEPCSCILLGIDGQLVDYVGERLNLAHGWDGTTPLILAALRGNLDIVKIVVKKGANVRHKCRDGWTAEDHAFFAGHTEIGNFLRSKIVL
jgi:hypothetical protein